MVGPTTPLVVLYCVPRLLVYFTESAKYASSAVIRLRRSDFIEARYAFSFVLANFGIAIAARMPMITTTIRSSISVKPLRFVRIVFEILGRREYVPRGGGEGQRRAPVRHPSVGQEVTGTWARRRPSPGSLPRRR